MSDNQHDPIELPDSDNGETSAPESDLATQLAEAQATAAEYLDGWQRARAEMANLKKRQERDKALMQSTLKGDVLLSLLPAIDDFDTVMVNRPEDSEDSEWAKAVGLVYKKLTASVTEQGLEEIDALGAPFDPAEHEAVMTRADDDAESDTVVEVLRKGYRLGERVLRPSMVVVAD